MEETKESTIGQSVADEFNSADEFEAFGIDFCCGMNRSIQEDYEQKADIDKDKFMECANVAKDNCPVSKALDLKITLHAELEENQKTLYNHGR